MIPANLAQRIENAVDAAFDAQLSWTQKLIAEPSMRGQEQSAQDLIAGAYANRGLPVDRWRIDSPELRAHIGYGPTTVDPALLENVVATYTPRTHDGRSLILNGHVDVVPTGPDATWSRSPWDAQIIDGWLYGRGSGDMKAGLAANLFAFDAIRAAGLRPTAPIYLESVVEEECTGNGSLAASLRGYRADAVLIPEPEENMLVRANVGVIWFEVRVEGAPTHVREMGSGQNAIDHAYSVMTVLRKLEQRWNDQRGSHPHFADLEHPINFNFGTIAGGDWPSSVPAWCTFEVRAAIYPGVSAADAWAEVAQVVQEAAACLPEGGTATATPNGFFAEGYVLEPGSEAETALETAHARAFGGPLRSFTTPGYLDGRVFVLYDQTPTLVYGPVSEAIHGFDERVEVESVRRVTKAIALFIAEWCGVEEDI